MEIDGRFWLNKDNKPFLGEGRVRLLKQIDEHGSIHAASKAMKMSYKAAWDMLRDIDKLSKTPFLEKQIGGKSGGGTKLTPYAREMIATYDDFHKLYREFIERFKEAGDNPQKLKMILNRTFLTTSARNQLLCKVISLDEHKLGSIISLKTKEGETLKSKITTKSLKNIGIKQDASIYAIIKSSDIKIVFEAPKETQKCNVLKGDIELIEKSDENIEITFKTDKGLMLTAFLESNANIKLSENTQAYAIIEYDNILIGV
ncbi:MAG: LysR family transcriptional regulator [Campylobacterales bacterium]|nr:LysR family transcriptional regulator [Campylobacterales bacterium]